MTFLNDNCLRIIIQLAQIVLFHFLFSELEGKNTFTVLQKSGPDLSLCM